MWAWRSRVRGEIIQTWDSISQTWVDNHFLAFFVGRAEGRGVKGIDKPWGVIPFEDLQKAVVGYTIQKEELRTQEMLDNGMTEQEVEAHVPGYATPVEFVDWEKVDERMSKEDPNWRASVRKQITGVRIYLPNIIIRLVRNLTPPGLPYDPFIATFRIPTSMTKIDLRSYLKAVYDLDVSFIRTDIFQGNWRRVRRGRNNHRESVFWERRRGSEHDYKRAIVGLFEPFHYPDDVEEMKALGREMRLGNALVQQRVSYLKRGLGITKDKNATRQNAASGRQRAPVQSGAQSGTAGESGVVAAEQKEDEVDKERLSRVSPFFLSLGLP
jgi:ribosomal protein L23